MKDIVDERQIHFTGVNDIQGLSKYKSIMTVVYASTNYIFIFDASDLSENEKLELVNALIDKIQSGTKIKRDVVHKADNVYFVY